jgi:pimeloyl-ACP methyl ester carboxylesterase
MKLVFLPGSGCSSNVWRHQIAKFDNGIALNLPGHPDGMPLDSVSAMADWLTDYLNKMECQQVILVGHSLGGAVALQAAINGHHSIKGLVLIGTGARLKVMPMILDTLSKLIESKADVPDIILAANQGIAEPLRTDINQAIKHNGVATLLNDFNACNKFDVIDKLSAINVPMQIIVGSKDVMTPPKYAEFIHSNTGSSQLSIIDGGSHMVFAEQPMQVNAVIEKFLTEGY